MNTKKKNIRSYFDSHPTVKEFHFTNDGLCFERKDDANAHAETLKERKVGNGEVETYSRLEVEAWKMDEEEEAPKPYSERTVKELKVELANRSIMFDTKSDKEALIKLLEESDKADQA